MNINPSNIARDRTTPGLELPNNLRCAPRETIRFCTPDEKFRRTMQNVNHTGATTSKSPSENALRQNSKIPERETISPQKSPNQRRKTRASALATNCAKPRGGVLRSAHFPAETRRGRQEGRIHGSLFRRLGPFDVLA